MHDTWKISAVIRQAIIDTGPLVAFLDRDERNHEWSVAQIQDLVEPLLVCEAVLTEALFLLRRMPSAQIAVLNLLNNGALDINFRLADNLKETQALLAKYADVPMSLADACIVRMAELNAGHAVFTLDSDFRIYRKYGNKQLKLISPAG